MKTHRKLNGVLPPMLIRSGNFEVIDKAPVDDRTWYTVQGNTRIREWLKTQPQDLWYAHTTSNGYRQHDAFDVDERLYTMMVLKWS